MSIKNAELLRYINLLIITVVVVSLSGCADIKTDRHLRIAHGLDRLHPVHLGLEHLAEKAFEKSDGKLKISVYPSQQLGTERECLELLQIGSLDMVKVSASVLEGFVPIFKIFSLPYIFRNDVHKFKVFNGEIGKYFLESTSKYRFKGLCYYDAGSRSFYTKDKPIRTPDDLTGLKIRTQESATSIKLVNSLGGSATPISWGELYTALQQGVVDGAENNPPSFYLSRHYEVCKYFVLDEHTSVPDVLVISTSVWNDLSEDEKRWLQEAANESAEFEKSLWKEATEHALEEVKNAGVEVSTIDKSLFIDKVKPLIESYKDDELVYNLIQKIKAVK